MMKNKRKALVLGMVLALALGLALAVEAEVKKTEACKDKQLCAEKIRFGIEAFNRGRYGEAKAYFRQAVQADSSSAKAWGYYDLCILYDVAGQFKRAGKVVESTAISPAAPAPGGQAPAPAPAPAPPPAPSAGGVVVDDEGC